MNWLYLSIIARQLTGRPVRTGLTVMGIALTFAIALAVIGLSRGLTTTVAAGIEEPGADLVVTPADALTIVGGSVPVSLQAQAAAVAGVEGASAALFNFVTVDGKLNVVAWGWPDGSYLWSRVALQSGRLPQAGETDVAVIGERTAVTLGKRIGDTFEIEFQRFRIVGLARYRAMLNQDVVMVPLSGLQAALGRTGSATFIQVRLTRPLDPAAAAATRAALTAAAHGYSVLDTGEFVQNIRIVRVIGAVADVLTILMIALTLVIVANTQFMAVSERMFDFGVLSAIGWSRGRIMGLVLWEGALLGLAGVLGGLLLGMVVTHVAARAIRQFAEIEPSQPAGALMVVATATLFAGVAGAVAPAWRASRMPAAEALRRG